MVYSRITDDLFVHLNRERTLLQISIFQYDYLENIDPSLRGKIKASGCAKQLRDELKQTTEMALPRHESSNPIHASTNLYIEETFVDSFAGTTS